MPRVKQSKKKLLKSKAAKIPVRISTATKSKMKKIKTDINISSTDTSKESLNVGRVKKIEPTNLKKIQAESSITKSRSINLYRKIAISFIFLTILLLVAVFYFSFVSLKIILTPNQERISDNLIVDIYDKDNLGTAAFSKEKIPGAVEQIAISEEKIYSSSGLEIIGEEVVGRVVVINNYNKNQPLVATTRLLSPEQKLFRIKETINVPAGGNTEVEIYADKPDETMAIGPTKFIIPGLWAGLQDKIYAESKKAFSYGKQTNKYIEAEDIDIAVKDLKKALLEKAENELGKNYKGFDQVIYEIDENSINVEVDGKAGEKKAKFNVKIKALINIVAFTRDRVANMAREKLLTIVPDNKDLFNFNKDKLVYTINNYSIKQGVASINTVFDGEMAIKSSADIIDRNKIVGLTREQLFDYLDSFPEIAGYEVDFSPSFINKVPNLVDRMEIKIEDGK